MIGLPGGVAVLQFIIVSLAREYELKLCLGALTYCVRVLVTFGTSLAVGWMVVQKSGKIDMAEALMGLE